MWHIGIAQLIIIKPLMSEMLWRQIVIFRPKVGGDIEF
jgi:hypothetical protein